MARTENDEAMKARISRLLMKAADILYQSIPLGDASVILAFKEVSRLFSQEYRELQEEDLRKRALAESQPPPAMERAPLQPKLPRRFGTSHHRTAKPDDPTKR